MKEGSDVTIIACGPVVYEAMQAHDQLKGLGISARVIDMHTVKPLDEAAVVKAAKETGAIVTVEEAQVFGGLGGAVAEALVKAKPVPVEMMGAQDTFLECGTPDELMIKYGLTAKGIVAAVQKVLARK